MVRIAPVRLTFNPKTLWFDAGEFELGIGDAVIVSTARGNEFGHVSDKLFDMQEEDEQKLKSPLKPVLRLASEEDAARADELADQAREALPTFKRLAAEMLPDINPVAVEYMFEGDKAVFYFESEERVDFRDLVRKLAAEFHVRVDMKQIGVRDSARMVGGLGHCGQELCCRRLGGEFNPVSIRMAKEQDLSLNPQKISGVCGRLMCCLRYEFDAYKDFHSRAPKKNATITTPEGEGKVVDLDVPREVVSIKVGDDKPVRVPLADMEPAEEGARPNAVGEEAWERATEPAPMPLDSALSLFTNELTGEDKLAEPGKVRRVHDEEPEEKPTRSRRRRRSSAGKDAAESEQAKESQPTQRKSRRRRSTTVKSDGSTQIETEPTAQETKREPEQKPKGSSRRRRSRASSGKQQAKSTVEAQAKGSKVGRNSSGLRAGRAEASAGDASTKQQGSGNAGNQRRRRRSHRTGQAGTGEGPTE